MSSYSSTVFGTGTEGVMYGPIGDLNFFSEEKPCRGCTKKFLCIHMMRRSTGWHCTDCDPGPTAAQGASRPGGPNE